ncbi:hypothetical protein A3A54_02480 [Candidatus Curtissbacteria bacterium RIFCSPLOWO2_01_FULL_39_62]|uniref:Four helix bundle protein n=2 Tax=Candidatus Curtissiibacteriota TaxID=1752717 RepID=A0A1F5G9M6_9BACT|nr:MAG: hypothetical protein A3D04_03185 [Candidatus Curtissbacteria bacterium RIFCSPHIGHO2_02_FULL_40_16b]OGE00402.1 MAG: hypothetical protein A3J17_02065 [Candidatus Curtissbacteria bacterium RIFCSPLOWO2_02_FULL_40_11]OGE00797.1 MAG: hypothetical protein A3A54_02480 [Candidatus Curtissbacteria bacterium RIFCSPLOWO2_01_FULL_39_62]OGE12901.1 MAG: hypothetical protein A3G14_03765 [Candidatus Curtissbacteria bacterium RIFCSPLOWO2_12_FULL_38_9]
MKKYDIHDRIFSFIVRVIEFLNKIPKTPTNLVFINQCTRSATSMGANDQEADGTQTKKDFVHMYTIVRKEGKETVYWVKLIENTNSERYRHESWEIVNEGNEIIAVVSTIIKNTLKSSKLSK